MGNKRNYAGAFDPTAAEAIENLTKSNERMRKALRVAQMALDMCRDELGRR